MSNIIISPNMGLIIPVVGVDPGPDWATNLNASLMILDGHDHSNGYGAQITAYGININAPLSFNSNDLTFARSIRFINSSSSLSGTLDLGCIYEANGDLWYNDASGNRVRITQNGYVTGAAGTITGMIGSASVAYVSGTFVFQSGVSTPATLSTGPLVIGSSNANSKTITISPNAAQSTNYSLTLPLTTPTVNASTLTSDTSGNMSWSSVGQVPLGGVIPTFPNLTGAYNCTATTVADANGFVLCNGQTISDALSPMNGQVIPNLNNSNFIMGSSAAGSAGGSNTHNLAHTHDLAGTHTHPVGGSTVNLQAGTSGNYYNLLIASGATAYSPNSGSTASALGSTDTRPAFISSVYIMRIK